MGQCFKIAVRHAAARTCRCPGTHDHSCSSSHSSPCRCDISCTIMLQEYRRCPEGIMTTALRSIGSFQVLGTLCTGAHSTILHIRRTADSKQYALKVVPIASPDDLKYVDQAEHEFEISQKLDHPNLIKIYSLETARNWMRRIRKIHLLIEYVNGKTLDVMP